MKNILIVLTTLLTLLAAGRADYVIVQKVEGSMQSGQMTLKLKDGKMRVDIAPEISTITDGATGEVITLMHGQKGFMRMPADRAKALLEQMQKLQSAAQPGPPQTKPTSTGKKDKVENHDCEIYAWTGSGISVTYWVAKNFPNYANINAGLEKAHGGGLGAMAKTMMPSAADLPGMAVKTQMTMNGQKVTTTIVSVTEENVDPSAFAVPTDYKELPMPVFSSPGAPPK